MDDLGYVGNNLIEKRYDAVLHMVTAAEGAEEFYNYSNAARFENEEGARSRDHLLREAYLGHAKHEGEEPLRWQQAQTECGDRLVR